ncbi:MAG: protein phosphatase 2C domain-containing protein [Nocardioides sp.]|nr:protein phosphatase 2C domain-containing protein [Nocardioides sp.]
MRQVELHHGVATDVGHVRATNEDSFLAEPPLYVVADGMGGHDGGEVASRIVVEEFGRLADAGWDPLGGPAAIGAALARCQQQIKEYDAAQRRAGSLQFHSATTAVVAMLVEDGGQPAWLVANVGDSRAYRFCDGRLEQVTVDHSRVQELWEAGEITEAEIAGHPERNVVTRAVGGPRRPEADFFLLPLPVAERLLLASDGIFGMIAHGQVEDIVATSSDPRDAADRLVAAALAAGGRDNATAVVVDVMGLASENSYDSARQRVSLEQKLGALP